MYQLTDDGGIVMPVSSYRETEPNYRTSMATYVLDPTMQQNDNAIEWHNRFKSTQI